MSGWLAADRLISREPPAAAAAAGPPPPANAASALLQHSFVAGVPGGDAAAALAAFSTASGRARARLSQAGSHPPGICAAYARAAALAALQP